MSLVNEGMGMSRSTADIDFSADLEVEELDQGEEEGPSEDISDLFRLSGGVAYATARTANRIDGLLSRMLEHPSAGRYVDDVDRNLDYLLTHLELDLIEQMARDVAATEERTSRRTTAPPEEPMIPLDRVRPSL